MDDIKEKIINEVSGMLESGMAAEAITVREITNRLGISVSTINYHFGSKEALMDRVIKQQVDKVIAMVPGMIKAMGDMPPRAKLLRMVKATADYLAKFPSLSRISIINDLKSGYGQDNTFGTIKAYHPMIEAIIGPDKAFLCGMVLSFTLQGIFMRADVLRDEGILDYNDKQQRDDIIDQLFDIVLPVDD